MHLCPRIHVCPLSCTTPTDTDLSSDRVKNTLANGIVPAHPNYSGTNNANPAPLKPLVYIVPDQARPNHGSATSRTVGDLGELSGVDVDSLGRRESEIPRVAAALDLKHQSQTFVLNSGSQDVRVRLLTANGVFVEPITLSWSQEGVRISKRGMQNISR